MIPEWNSFINGDCMDYMKEFPDNYFSLAIVDPPYGAGFTESGGCKGWFSKYHQNAETPEILGGRAQAQFYNRFGNEGSRFQKYKDALYERDAEVSEELQEDIGGRKQKKIISWDVAPGKEVAKIDINTGEIICVYKSIADAARKNGIKTSSNIGMCCRKLYGRKTIGGYRWEYMEGENNG